MVALSTNARLIAAAVTPSPSSTVRATSLNRGRSMGTISCGMAILMRSMDKGPIGRIGPIGPIGHRARKTRLVYPSRRDPSGRCQPEDFAGQILIVDGAGTFGSVREHRLAEARAFGQLDVPADARLQNAGARPRHGLPA